MDVQYSHRCLMYLKFYLRKRNDDYKKTVIFKLMASPTYIVEMNHQENNQK